MAIFRGVAVLSLLLLLISCSKDDPRSDTSDRTSQTPTASATPSPTGPVEPEPPERSSKPTKASAIAFVKYYWEVANYAQATAKSDLLRSLASKNCAFCAGGVSYIDGLRAKGGVVVKPRPYTVTVTRARLGKTGNGGDAGLVTCKLAVPKSVEFYGEGAARNKHFPGGHRTYVLFLEWIADSSNWELQEVERV
jgi:hypothetical protein